MKSRKFVTNYLLSASATLLLCVSSATADTRFEGLFYPQSGEKPKTCSSIKNEFYQGGMIIDDGTIYRGESTCKLQQPRASEHGTQFIANCLSEGKSYRDLVTLSRTPNGLSEVSSEGKREWLACVDTNNTSSSSTRKSNWKSKRYSDGTIERTISNKTDDQIIFTCKNGGDGSILVVLSSQNFSGGNVDFVVDGKRSSLMTWADSIEVNTECRVCADHYTSLMENIRTGRSMSVVANGGKPVQFDISGVDKVFDQEVCGPKGW